MAKHVLHTRSGWRRRAARTAAAVGLLVGAAAVPALTGPASAAGPLPTTTTVTASPSTSVSGAAVTLTANVRVLGLPVGVVVTPTGNVAFSLVQGGISFPIATVPLASCPLSACTATTTTTKLRAGTTSVVAAYAGDTAAAASTGSVAVTVTPASTPGPLSSTTCAPDVPCTTKASAGTTSVSVTSTSAAQQTVFAQVLGGQVGCPGDVDPPAGVAVFFDNTAADAGKTVTYTTTGAAGAQTIANYTAHPAYLGCYAAPTPFLGYTSGAYGPATLVPDDGGPSYKAQLARCAVNGNVTPCFSFQVGYPDGRCPPASPFPNGAPPNCGNGKNAVAPDRAIVTIFTPVGDPKFSG